MISLYHYDPDNLDDESPFEDLSPLDGVVREVYATELDGKELHGLNASGVAPQALNREALVEAGHDVHASEPEEIRVRSLEVKDHESLYTPTFQGHYYWGPESKLNPRLKGFEASNIDRSAGVLFSERDQFVFKTLLYPARVRFGYQKEDPEGHRRDLEKVEPLLDEPLDLEVKLYNMLRHVSTPLKGFDQYQDLHLNLKTQFINISKRSDLNCPGQFLEISE